MKRTITKIKINKKEIIVGYIFFLLLFFTGLLQTHLKVLPQIYMFIFGGLTLASSYLKSTQFFTTLIYTLLGVMLFISLFSLVNYIDSMLYPKRGWIIVDGVERRVMDWSWINGLIVGLIGSPIFLLLYKKLKLRNKQLEINLTVVFIIETLVIFLVNEVF